MSIKILIYGGLGNQLFQFAFGESLRLSFKNLEIKYIDLTKYYSAKRVWELGFLNIKPHKVSRKEIISIFLKRILNSKINKYSQNLIYFGILNDNQYDHIFEYLQNKRSFIIDGYWQSEEYFFNNKMKIKKILNITKKNPINKKETNFEKVAVHIRLGDYVNTSKGRENHLVCDIEWYKNSINYLKKFNSELKFTIFSDDKKIIESEFSDYKDLEIYDSDYSKSAYEDLYEMSNYDHFIISNSSYSWWASYLGENKNTKIIAPKYWYKNVKTTQIPLFRENWIIL